MDGESQPTQQATQNVLDPRRLGKQNSGFTDEDIADIVCLLFPYTPNTRSEAARLARERCPFVIGGDDAQAVDVDYDYEDYADHFALSAAAPSSGPAFILRLSDQVKNPLQGFTFGRNASRCDICFSSDNLRRLSNIHFRIFINEHGVLMLQDQSTNGTVVDDLLLKSKSKPARPGVSNMRTLISGTKISILLQNHAHDLAFLVRVPRREGRYEAAYLQNLEAYLQRRAALAAAADEGALQQQQQRTAPIAASPAGVVNLFPTPRETQNQTQARPPPPPLFSATKTESLPREWNGSGSYNRVGKIGKGAFATVHKVTAKFDGKPYAAKELEKRRFIKNGVLDQKVENEMKIMQKIQHPNIVRYIEHFDFDDRLFIIIMEFVSGGDLGSYIATRGCLSEAITKAVAAQLLDALGYLHRKNITHRDVKPDNILIDSQSPFNVKLTDFGLSKMVDNEQTFLQTFCGTLLYCAPEVYAEYEEYDENGHRNHRNRQRNRAPGQRYDHAVDIWSLGGVLFYCLTGSPPFPARQGTSYTELLHWIMTQPLDVSPLHAAYVSPECVHFLSQMLQRRPEHRATVEALQAHPWLASPAVASTEEIEQSASQLSLQDDQLQNAAQSADEIMDEDDLIGDDSEFRDLVSDFVPMHSQKENLSDGFERGETIRQHAPRLFGEVAVSAIGSSGVIAEDRLNLPLSDLGDGYSAGSDSEADSVSRQDEVFVTPRGDTQRAQQGQQWSQPHKPARLEKQKRGSGHGTGHVPEPLSQSHNFQESHSVNELNNMTFDVASQSLGGAESILGNLFVKSLAPLHATHSNVDLASSKRKPALDNSDEFDSGALHKPTIKRLRSEVRLVSTPGRTDDENNNATNDIKTANTDDYDDASIAELYAAVKPISHSKTGRQIDLPINKSVYWTPGEPDSWHLHYPEMTQLQRDVFEDAAVRRHEEFRPGRSRLWDLAMKHFPPTPRPARAQSDPLSNIPDTATPSGSGDDDNEIGNEQKENIVPSASLPNPQSRTQLQHEPRPALAYTQPLLEPHAQIVVPILAKKEAQQQPLDRREHPIIAARLDATPDSVVQDIAIPITTSVTSWGRGPENTQVYSPVSEKRVPKCALKILLWRGADTANGHGRGHGHGSEPWKDLQPWDRLDAHGEAASRYHFYISTRARQGIFVNGTYIGPAHPGSAQGPSSCWVRLHDGDTVVVWYAKPGSPEAGAGNQTPLQTRNHQGRTSLAFQCTWGGSAMPRRMPGGAQAAASATRLVDEMTSRRLDDACQRVERFLEQRALQLQRLADAADDVAERQARIDLERERSVAFEELRAQILSRHPGLGTGQGHRDEPRRPKPSSTESAPPVVHGTNTNSVAHNNDYDNNGAGKRLAPDMAYAVAQESLKLATHR